MWFVSIDEELNLVEQDRKLLNFIDYDQSAPGFEGLPQILRAGAQLSKGVRFEEVVKPRVREEFVEKRALPGLP